MSLASKKIFDFFKTSSNAGKILLALLNTKFTIQKETTNLILDKAKLLYLYFSLKGEGTTQSQRRQLASVLDTVLINTYVAKPADEKLATAVLASLNLLTAATGMRGGLQIYSPNELGDALEKGFDGRSENGERLIYSLAETLKSGDRRDEALAAWSALERDKEKQEFNFREMLLRSLLLDIVWVNFWRYLGEGKKMLLTNFFYQGIAVGAPVREALKKFLYDTTMPVEYILRDKFLYDCLSENSEQVPISTAYTAFEGLDNLIKEYKSIVPVEKRDERQMNAKYIVNLYKNQQNNTTLIEWLSEAFDIYFLIEQANLIDHNAGGEIQEDDKYNREMMILLSYFFKKEWWGNIVTYFNRKKPRVPMINFISQLIDNFELDETDNADKIIEFNNFLHLNNLLSPDQDLLYFSESEGKFMWNPPSPRVLGATDGQVRQ